MRRVTSKGNEAKSKMKISYAHAEIQTQVVVICGLTCYQLDHRGNKDNNYIFVVLLIHTLVHPVIKYWSYPQAGQEFSSCGCSGDKSDFSLRRAPKQRKVVLQKMNLRLPHILPQNAGSPARLAF